MFGLFKKNKGNDTSVKTPKGFHEVRILSVEKLTSNSVKMSFDIPASLQDEFKFIPGQYVNICTYIDGIEQRRSYSICSGQNEALAIAIKSVENGVVSKWANEVPKSGDTILVSKPMGGFVLDNSLKQVIAIAAGSGITPFMSMAKSIEESDQKMTLYYGNRTENSIMFQNDLAKFTNTSVTHYLSGESRVGFESGRIDKEVILGIFKGDLTLLKADGFYLCGPQEMVQAAQEVLTLFGVPKQKIHIELFTALTEKTEESLVENETTFTGKSHIKVILDDEVVEFEQVGDSKTLLDATNNAGLDAPYSCRGGVCSTCRAKVIEGKVTMKLNYSLTDQEVAEGYILTCQAFPASENLVISYDE